MDQHLDEVQQYKNLPVGDLWEDAHLLPVLDYLMNSKLLRIPEEWTEAIHAFYGEYRSTVLGDASLTEQLMMHQAGASSGSSAMCVD